MSAHEGQGLVMWRQASQGQRVSPAHGGRLPWVGTFDAVGGHFCAAGDIRRRRGPGSCPRARRVSPSAAACTRPRGMSSDVQDRWGQVV